MRAALLVAALLHPHHNVATVCTQEAKSPEGVVALIKCAAPKLGVSTDRALCTARRESRYQPWAKNPRSSAAGVYQFLSGTWRGVVNRYLYGHLLGPVNVYNGRMNVVLALRYVRAGGWGPWNGGCG